jgi:hypothetical protein
LNNSLYSLKSTVHSFRSYWWIEKEGGNKTNRSDRFKRTV